MNESRIDYALIRYDFVESLERGYVDFFIWLVVNHSS